MTKTHPNVYIIAGPNGAGKTTFAEQFLPLYVKCKIFVNADHIAAGLAKFAPETVSIKAGRILLKELRNLANHGSDFSFETTLSGRTYISFLKVLKSRGYQIHIFFLWISHVNLALARIKERVERGGHNIPVKDVRRRFTKSLDNFLKDYKPLANSWSILDNSVIPPKLIAKGQLDEVEIIDENLYEQIVQKKR